MDRKGTVPAVLLFLWRSLRHVSRHECGHYLLEMTGWKDILSGYCQLKLSNEVFHPSMIMTEGWSTAAAHGRVSLLFSCSMAHPFKQSRNESWDKPVWEDKGKPLHVLLLETQGKNGGRGHTGIPRRLNCVRVSVYRETEVKGEKEVDRAFCSTPSFNPPPLSPLPILYLSLVQISALAGCLMVSRFLHAGFLLEALTPVMRFSSGSRASGSSRW